MNSTIAGDHRAGVLVVDDEPDVREALSDMLEHEGYVVHSVGTGTAAVQQAAQFRYEAVLLDIGLPDLDGHSVLKFLTEMDANLPVVILTGNAKMAEAALSESEERFRSVVQSTADAVILAEESGRIMFWNKAAQHMFGYTDQEAMGKPLTMIMPAR